MDCPIYLIQIVGRDVGLEFDLYYLQQVVQHGPHHTSAAYQGLFRVSQQPAQVQNSTADPLWLGPELW